ncbi:MAG: arsenate reductase (azurin) small subunit [Rhodospirillales bacterium]|nr:arsenate reductase (azurin) small subunit [Rhodospirillales bacterium]
MKKCPKRVDLGRRQFLRGTGVAAAGVAAATVVPTGSAQAAGDRANYPSTRLANIKDLKANKPMDISYPDDDSPGVLIKLGSRVDGGAGPDGDVVAYSIMCPHKGYTLEYDASDKTLNCPGHYSRFDCEMEGQQVFGHSNQSLPMFSLRVDSKGDIHAEGVDELIYGRVANIRA